VGSGFYCLRSFSKRKGLRHSATKEATLEGQNNVARKAKARECAAEIAGNV
jgi:hypothetical protein